MVRALLAAMLVLMLGACSSTQPAKKIDTKLDQKGSTVVGERVGLDDDGQAIVQKETDADTELRNQRWKNADLENKLNYERDALKRCRDDMADSRLGGNGEVTEIPEVDSLADVSKAKEEFGITEEGKLQVVKKELYTQRLKAERDYGALLESQIKTVGKYRTDCERKMGYARVKAGLPSTRYVRNPELGYEYETNLDIAFKNLEKAKKRKGQAKPVVDEEASE